MGPSVWWCNFAATTNCTCIQNPASQKRFPTHPFTPRYFASSTQTWSTHAPEPGNRGKPTARLFDLGEHITYAIYIAGNAKHDLHVRPDNPRSAYCCRSANGRGCAYNRRSTNSRRCANGRKYANGYGFANSRRSADSQARDRAGKALLTYRGLGNDFRQLVPTPQNGPNKKGSIPTSRYIPRSTKHCRCHAPERPRESLPNLHVFL